MIPPELYLHNTLISKKDSLDNDLILHLLRELKSEDNDVNKSFSDSGVIKSWRNNSLISDPCWTVTLSFKLDDLFKESIPGDKLSELTKMSDKDLGQIKTYIEDNEKSIFDKVIFKRVNEVYSILVDKVKELDSNLQEYSNTEVFENLSLKELFEKIYYEE